MIAKSLIVGVLIFQVIAIGVSYASSETHYSGTYTGVLSFFPSRNTTCGPQTIINAAMTCKFDSDNFTCSVSSTPTTNSTTVNGLYSVSDDHLSISWTNNQTLCISVQKTFNELVGIFDIANPAGCPTSFTQCDAAGTDIASRVTFDIFGPGLSSFELFGILVAAAALVIITAVIAETCRHKTSEKSHLKFFVLAMGMTISGTINTISTKYADISYGEGIDGTIRQFDHPFFQATAMFVGEMLCGVVAIIMMCCQRSKGDDHHHHEEPRPKYNPMIFILPACCDMVGTCLLYVGLLMTYASVFQMLRGSVVIWTGILSFFFLKKKLRAFHWTGMILVLGGLALVGVASLMLGSGSNAPNPMVGDILVLAACVVTAIQMVVEEKFINQYNVPPLQVVGWEGLWGFSILTCGLVVMYFVPGSSGGNHFENSLDAFIQISNSTTTMLAILGNLCSIALFNFFGISMTQYSSATTRTIIDTIRTIVIWSWGLLIGWQAFQYLQVIGFVLLLLGTMIYNHIVKIPLSVCREPVEQPLSINDEKQPLVTKQQE